MFAGSILGFVFSICAFCEIGYGHLVAEVERTQSTSFPDDVIISQFSTSNGYKPQVPNLSGKWYATLRCSFGSGRYIYYFEQTRNGRLSGKSRGVSFGVKNITGFLVTGSFSATSFEFFEQVSEGYFLEVSGSTRLAGGYIFATYKNTRTDNECSLRMKKMRDQRLIEH